VDGSVFSAREATASGREAVFDAERVRKLPLEAVGSILFSGDAADRSAWRAGGIEPRTVDRLVAARDDKRLTLDGAVVSVGKEKVVFAMDGDELPINRARVIAVYFAQRKPTAEPVAAVSSTDGAVWTAARLAWKDGVELETPSGVALRIPESELAAIDFSLGKVLYLSDANPSAYRHTPAFDRPWPILRDRGPTGGEPRIDDLAFRKALVVHSRSMVEYRLDGKYRLLQTQLGVDAAGGPLGNAEVRIAADGKPLWKGAVRAGEPAQALSLSVAGAQSVQLEVDYGENLDLGDHVTFGDLRVVK
jgi:hypothetical protein